jgi:hypothetical protein
MHFSDGINVCISMAALIDNLATDHNKPYHPDHQAHGLCGRCIQAFVGFIGPFPMW